jgi:hypothetical protein
MYQGLLNFASNSGLITDKPEAIQHPYTPYIKVQRITAILAENPELRETPPQSPLAHTVLRSFATGEPRTIAGVVFAFLSAPP